MGQVAGVGWTQEAPHEPLALRAVVPLTFDRFFEQEQERLVVPAGVDDDETVQPAVAARRRTFSRETGMSLQELLAAPDRELRQLGTLAA